MAWSAWLILVAACYTGPTPAIEEPPAPPPPRPAFSIAGHWSYRVRTNECNTGTGTGAVDFTPIGGGSYAEAGSVVWPDGSRIEWNGEMRLSQESMMSNSLEDTVESRWFLDREHDQLVVRWRQSNGCSGIGIATRAGHREPRFAALSVCARCEHAGSVCVHTIDDGDVRGRAGSHPRECPMLCCR